MPHAQNRRTLNRRALLRLSGTSALTIGLGTIGLGKAAMAADLPPQPTPRDWAKSPALRFVCLSPGGTHIAYMREENGRKYLYEYVIATKAFQIYDLGTAKIASIWWIDDGHLAVTSMATDKFEAFSGGRDTYYIVSVYNLQARTINTLFSQIEGFKSFVSGGVRIIRQNGKRQLTASSFPINYDEARYLYRFDLDRSANATVMDRAPWHTENWILTPEGEMLARATYSPKTKIWELQHYDRGLWKTIFSQHAELDYPNLVGLGRDGQSVVVFMNSGETKGHYYEVSADGVFSSPLPIKGLTAEPIFDPKTFRLSGYTTYDGWTQEHYFDPAMNALVEKARASVEGYRMSIIDLADDPRQMIISSEGEDDAGTYYFLDLKAGTSLTIGAEYPHIPPEWITTKTVITYTAADGLEIEAYLSLPPNRDAKNLPLVVLPHGGPVARDGQEFDSESQAYASRGYAVLQPNFRGSSGYGEDFVEAGYGQWGRKMQTDLSDGVRHLVKAGTVDPKRVCIVGTSYGGYAALAGAAFDPGMYRCAVDVAGVTDLSDFLESIRGYDATTESTTYRGEKRLLGDPTTYAEVSPVFHAAKMNIPILIVHGKDDTVVPFSQSLAMVNALKTAKKDVTFIQYDHTDHWETNEAARADMYDAIVAFIEKHNPPR
ncbi:hypothetical protein AEAC466_12920 [Asticcacaulis sp. AC466]|uniref:alpha/beta hydrolase family protein n=1 Tax=Asticcacaulis sp. AC466 TaxID=1282362 RepID=UPI0003C404ED|nr:prolyl oligopeptidase family serine peptidase [Asticcacaulis sp. AC466]ESQ83572.1 hypothetical protein AEAC466_12920 [Asticcacaulis sp. AC466]